MDTRSWPEVNIMITFIIVMILSSAGGFLMSFTWGSAGDICRPSSLCLEPLRKPGKRESVLLNHDDNELMVKVTYFVKYDNFTLKYEVEFR